MSPLATASLRSLAERVPVESGRPTLSEAPSLSIAHVLGIVTLLLIVSSFFVGTASSFFGPTVPRPAAMDSERQQTLDAYLQDPTKLPLSSRIADIANGGLYGHAR